MAGEQVRISRALVVLLMGIGLWTFFLPIVTTDAPVHGRSQWAPLELLVARAYQWRPAPHFHLVFYQIASIYVLMVLAILVLALPAPHKLLKLIAVIGSASSITLLGTRGPRTFSWLFYGRYTSPPWFNGDIGWWRSGRLHFTSAYFVLIAVMPLLLVALVGYERQSLSLKSSEQYITPDSDSQAETTWSTESRP
jgi:hypothetical protein